MFEKIKGLIKSLFRRGEKGLKNVLGLKKSDYYNHITRWHNLYKNDCEWKSTSKGGIKGGRRQLGTLNVAKMLCNEMANLTFSEQVNVSIGDDETENFVQRILQANAFWTNFPFLLESCFALGGAVLKVYIENNEIKIDYVTADRFVATSWNNRMITAGVFVSRVVKDNKAYNHLEYHSFENGSETIRHQLYLDESGYNRRVHISEVFPEMEEEVVIHNLATPLFAYIKPCVGNNIDSDSPLGISIYANAIDTLKALDIMFDSLTQEFKLGKKRIIVSSDMIKAEFDDNGHETHFFDTSDEVYQAFSPNDHDELKITDNTVSLRVDEHISGINAELNILCAQTGLSAGALSFDSAEGVKTATEVISQNSKTYRTVAGHQNLIREGIESLIRSIITLGSILGQVNAPPEYQIEVQFDDAIITDKNAEIDNVIKMRGANLITLEDALMKLHGYDADTARNKAGQILGEKRVSAGMIDFESLFA